MRASGARKPWVMPPRRRSRLLSPQRRKAMPPAKTLRELGLAKGMILLDVGCGPGFFTLPACRIVGRRGAVLACDISPIMLRETRQKAREAGHENIELRRNRDPHIPFPDSVADIALLAFVTHETRSIQGLLSEARRALKPGGRIVLMEWHVHETDHGPPLWTRIAPNDLKSEVRAAGFTGALSQNNDADTYRVTARAPLLGSGRGRR
ncbi:MAG: class I SAM-dependent methyltransferase [bacterium]|nr:class I SAM-dependent methyltransferase [bacterium]